MHVHITEQLDLDLEAERWVCRRCRSALGSARESYKEGILVHARDPREIHKPILDPERYEFTYAPDPEWVQILEYYCPSCGQMIEVEYCPPGYPPLHDIEIDVDALKKRRVTEDGFLAEVEDDER